MDGVYKFHDNLRKLMHEDTIDVALGRRENISAGNRKVDSSKC